MKVKLKSLAGTAKHTDEICMLRRASDPSYTSTQFVYVWLTDARVSPRFALDFLLFRVVAFLYLSFSLHCVVVVKPIFNVHFGDE